MTKGTNGSENESPEPAQYSVKTLIQSIFAAAFGVQSSENRERDFNQGRLHHFIIGGLVFTACFVGIVYLLVQLALNL